MSAPILVTGACDLALAVAERLHALGHTVLRAPAARPDAIAEALTQQLGALVVVAPPPARSPDFLAVDDDQLEAGLTAFVDLFELLGAVLPQLPDGASCVLVGHRGHLGAWGAAHEAAFAGAAAGLMRSVALETMGRGLRANVVATDFPDDRTNLTRAAALDEVAALTGFLLSPAAAALNGELLLANRGASLRIREAKNRAAPMITGEHP